MVRAALVYGVQSFLRAGVIDCPENTGLTLRPSKPAGFANIGVFETTDGLKMQRCRLLRTGAAGKRQQY